MSGILRLEADPGLLTNRRMSIEIGLGRGGAPDKMEIERVTLNPVLDDQLFAKPGSEQRRAAGAFGADAPRAGNSGLPMAPSTRPAVNPDPGPVPR